MFRALGSTSLHQAMNDRMVAMVGEQGERRIHQLLGARYVGCSASTGAAGSYGGMMGGSGMMGGYYNHGGLGQMMSSSNWRWMVGGAWQNMTRHDWKRLQHQLLGTNSSSGGNGWSPFAIIAATLAAVLLVASRRRSRLRPTPASTSCPSSTGSSSGRW